MGPLEHIANSDLGPLATPGGGVAVVNQEFDNFRQSEAVAPARHDDLTFAVQFTDVHPREIEVILRPAKPFRGGDVEFAVDQTQDPP